MVFYKKTFFLIFILIILLFSIIIYYLYKKIYLQNNILKQINNFEHFIQNVKNKDYELNENIINYIMTQWSDIELINNNL